MGTHRRMGKKRVLVSVILLYACVMCLKNIFRSEIDPSSEAFTNLNLCPACYGRSLCPSFFHGKITLIGPSKLRYLQFLNRKNVFYGRLDGVRVVLKRLAHDWEVEELDRTICSLADVVSCDPSAAIAKIVSTVPRSVDRYFLRVLKKMNKVADFTACPSERLMTYIYSKLANDFVDNNTRINEVTAEMIYGIYVNPESVILQAFTHNEGWPFPAYKGSCGRLIVEEYVGLSLYNFEESDWTLRLDLSYQLLQIAQQLTDNSLSFAFYMTDVTMDNFAVHPDGTVLLVDVENVVIVDRAKIREEKHNGWNHIHRNRGEACKDCLNFSYEDLCTHDMADHNFYAICKGLLVPQAYYSSKGFLHSIPSDIEQKTNISALLQECADPSSDIGRFVTVPKLLQVMKSLL